MGRGARRRLNSRIGLTMTKFYTDKKGKPYETQSVLIERRAIITKAFAKKKAMELKGD